MAEKKTSDECFLVRYLTLLTQHCNVDIIIPRTQMSNQVEMES